MTVLSFRDALTKAEPGPVDVHIAGAGGKKKPVSDEKTADVAKKDKPRVLRPIDEERSHTPFPYDAGALGRLREDQVPRFFGALTDSDKLDISTLPLASLVAMQNRVDHNKVKAIREAGGAGGKLPVVIRAEDRNYIADGHHRLTALWLDGATEAQVRFKDLTPETNIMKAGRWAVEAKIVKVDEGQRLAFGFFSVVEKNGERVVDSEDDRIAPDELEKAAYGHVLDARIASDGHERIGVGKLVESVVFTPEKTGAMVACLKQIGVEATIDIPAVAWWGGYYIHDDDVWKAVRDGDYVSFSIGGNAQRNPADGE